MITKFKKPFALILALLLFTCATPAALANDVNELIVYPTLGDGSYLLLSDRNGNDYKLTPITDLSYQSIKVPLNISLADAKFKIYGDNLNLTCLRYFGDEPDLKESFRLKNGSTLEDLYAEIKTHYVFQYTEGSGALTDFPADGLTLRNGEVYTISMTIESFYSVHGMYYDKSDAEKTQKVFRESDGIGSFTLKFAFQVVQDTPVPDNPPETYIVRYTDGVLGEEIFADQVYSCFAGTLTPAFQGVPQRAGYTFAGWSPAVNYTVTGNAVYEAQWLLSAALPQTGDAGHAALWAGVSALCLAGLAAIMRRKKRAAETK